MKKENASNVVQFVSKNERRDSLIRGYYIAQKILGFLLILISYLLCDYIEHRMLSDLCRVVPLIIGLIGVICFTKIEVILDPRISEMIEEKEEEG